MRNCQENFVILHDLFKMIKKLYKRGKPSPRSQAKSLHESPLQAVPILSVLLACPLPLLLGAQPLKPGSSQASLSFSCNTEIIICHLIGL